MGSYHIYAICLLENVVFFFSFTFNEFVGVEDTRTHKSLVVKSSHALEVDEFLIFFLPFRARVQRVEALDLGFRILDFGSWILDFGSWILDFGFRILDFGFRILDFGFCERFGFCIRLFLLHADSGRRINQRRLWKVCRVSHVYVTYVAF